MKIYYSENKKDMDFLRGLFEREAYPAEIEKDVSAILDEVRRDGDKALAKFAKKFDGADLSKLGMRISDDEFAEAEIRLDNETKTSIRFAIKNIQNFAKKTVPKNWKFSPRKGVVLGEKFSPLDRVGVYIPGGAAPLVSTAIHTAAIAKIAKVPEIVAVTPPERNGRNIPDALLFAMKEAGVNEAYRLGGVYAIGALAYGSETIKKVQKILGPGNAYVTAAKKLIYGRAGIDMAAGPSEIMIIADRSANPNFIAADLLSQAEHGSGHEQAVLLTTDETIAKKTIEYLKEFSEKIKKSEALTKVIQNGIFIIVVKSLNEAAKIANDYAPEHLEIICKNADKISGKITAAGAIFIGAWTPESAGDYVAGPSHVLPTGGTAKFFNGLSIEHFFRRSSIIKYSKDAMKREGMAIAKIANLEGLDAHALSAILRYD